MARLTLKEKLDVLNGENYLHVARVLGNRRIKGKKGDALHCPIANYLREEFGDDCSPSVGSSIIVTIDGVRVEADLPRSCNDFIQHFDNGDIPKLEEEICS